MVELPDTPDRPLLIVGVGHSGTTLVARWAMALGWDGLDADTEYAESVTFRRFNEHLLKEGYLPSEVWTWADMLPDAFVLKDPRLAVTLPFWRSVFVAAKRQPVLVWVYRPLEDVVASHRRRGRNVSEDPVIFGRPLSEHLHMIRLSWDSWPYGRVFIDMRHVARALSGFDPARLLQVESP